MRVDRGAADQLLVELEAAERVEDATGGGDDLGADAVAGEDDDARILRRSRSSARGTVSLAVRARG